MAKEVTGFIKLQIKGGAVAQPIHHHQSDRLSVPRD